MKTYDFGEYGMIEALDSSLPIGFADEHGDYVLLKDALKLEQQRDELLAALKSARRALATASTRYSIFNDDYDRADAAIAKAESC